MSEERATFNADDKFDIQLGQALIHERKLERIFTTGKIELKTETWLWERTGNICIEYEWNGKKSGIAATEAEIWIHQLKRGEETVIWFMFPVERLRALCREAYARGDYRTGSGDDGKSSVILLAISKLTRMLP